MSAATILLAYAGGLGCAPFLSPSPLLPLLPLLAAGAWFLLRRHRGGPICLAACFFLLGFAAYHQQLTPPDRPPHIRAFISDHPLVIEGELLAISARYPSGASLDLQAHLVGSQGIAAPVRGRVRLLVEDELPAARAGDRLRLRTRLRAPRLFGTPGEFNYPRFLAARGIFVTGFVPAARDIAIFPQGATSFEGWRQQIGRGIEAAVDPSLAPLVRALVIGDKGGITPEQRQLLARGGISHLFAISGLHLGLIALFLYGLAKSLYGRSERLLLWTPPRRCLPVLLLPLLFAYLQLTGDALPTRRAFLMAAVGALFLLWRRRTPPLRLLAAAALALLLVSPLALFEPSFQLSFAGLLGILLLVPPWAEKVARLPRLCRSPLLLLLTTAAATVATAPFALWHFHLLAPAGLLLNMAAVPAIGFLAVPLGLAGALLLPWWSAASAVLFGGCAQVLRVTLESCAWMVSFPWLAGWQMYLSPPRLTAAFLLAGGFLLLGRGKSWRPASLLIAGAIVLLALPAAAPSGLTVTVLSVGQG
ncbi:MAG: ComEC family competence protein, partial [Desulfuromonadales bacterium]|nr:ComEC family competence protein [Desulfuromonadales bacterium]